VAAIPHAWGVFLFKLVRSLRPIRVLELGTSLGVSASYLQHALSLNGRASQLVTMEGDAALCRIARDMLVELPHVTTEVVEGPFASTLPAVASNLAPVELAFIDGHHETEATLSYFQTLLDFAGGNAVMVFDDIEPFRRGVSSAWKVIRSHRRVGAAFHLVKMGIVVMSDR
jgi:predicted O-methyltransferase YrrM